MVTTRLLMPCLIGNQQAVLYFGIDFPIAPMLGDNIQWDENEPALIVISRAVRKDLVLLWCGVEGLQDGMPFLAKGWKAQSEASQVVIASVMPGAPGQRKIKVES